MADSIEYSTPYKSRKFKVTTFSWNTYEVEANRLGQDRDPEAGFHVFQNSAFGDAENEQYIGMAVTIHSEIATKRLILEGPDLHGRDRTIETNWISTSPVRFCEYREVWDV